MVSSPVNRCSRSPLAWSGSLFSCVIAGLVVGLLGCGPSQEQRASDATRDARGMDRLAPGEYRGAVVNASHKLNLDTLACEVDTTGVTVRLPDGDAVMLRVDAMQESDAEVWEIRGSEPRTGDRWVIRIQK